MPIEKVWKTTCDECGDEYDEKDPTVITLKELKEELEDDGWLTERHSENVTCPDCREPEEEEELADEEEDDNAEAEDV